MKTGCYRLNISYVSDLKLDGVDWKNSMVSGNRDMQNDAQPAQLDKNWLHLTETIQNEGKFPLLSGHLINPFYNLQCPIWVGKLSHNNFLSVRIF